MLTYILNFGDSIILAIVILRLFYKLKCLSRKLKKENCWVMLVGLNSLKEVGKYFFYLNIKYFSGYVLNIFFIIFIL